MMIIQIKIKMIHFSFRALVFEIIVNHKPFFDWTFICCNIMLIPVAPSTHSQLKISNYI